MRIVIELDGDGRGDVHLEPTARAVSTASGPPTPADDGGAGPSAGTAGAGADVLVVGTDAGPPPDWLLAAVGAAESAGADDALGSAEHGDGFVADAGAGPGAGAPPTTADTPGAPT